MVELVTMIHRFSKLISNWINFLVVLVMHLPYFIVDVYADTIKRLYRRAFPVREESLLNEVIVLVGAGRSSLGVELAMQLAATNAQIVLIDNPVNGAYESLVRKIKDRGDLVFIYDCDVTDKYSVRNVVETIEKDVGQIPTMVLHGNLLMNQASDKDLMYSYFHLLDAILPRMKVIKKGQMVFLSLINGHTDYSHYYFVQGLYESMREDMLEQRKKGAKIFLTQATVHKKLMSDGLTNSADDTKFGIFGMESDTNLARRIIKGVRQRKVLVSMPSYMVHVPTYLRVLPKTTADAIIDIMYRVY